MKRMLNRVARGLAASMLIVSMIMGLTACTAGTKSENGFENEISDSKLVVVGFSQVGSESSWRVANSESMKAALSEENGFELIFDDAKQKQENQYKAIRRFIQQNVDYIVLAPITETGWDDVLLEAKKADIPVIIVDRQVKVSNPTIYTGWVGSDFQKEGEKAVKWLEDELELRGRAQDEISILHLQGTIGATAQLMRTRGLEKALEEHENWSLAALLEGEYTEAKSYEVTKGFLEENPDSPIDVVYCENDNMAFGVMRALDEAGIAYGGEEGIIIVSFDAVRSALEACLEGKINLCVECNPLHGPRVVKIIQELEAGERIFKESYVEEEIFSYRDITREVIDSRTY